MSTPYDAELALFVGDSWRIGENRDHLPVVNPVTGKAIAEVPLAKQLGLENGDVLQTVNNEKIDSEQKVLEMVQKYQDAGSFRIGIMRNGKQKIITYNFR